MPDFGELISTIHWPTIQQIIFVMIATFTAAAALLTVLAPNVFHNAMGLVATLFGVAGIYILLEAEFLAVSQVLVYVGAISTLDHVRHHVDARHDAGEERHPPIGRCCRHRSWLACCFSC